jgi:hypothetical protein
MPSTFVYAYHHGESAERRQNAWTPPSLVLD